MMYKGIRKRLIAFVLFLILLWQIFSNLTYIFRNTGQNRERLLSFREEKENSLDAVFIGASCVFVYWDPMFAWGQYGITSYDYAVSDMPAATYLSVVKEIYTLQSPKVIVVDLRTFFSSVWQRHTENGIDLGAFRSVVDAMDLSPARIKAISDYCDVCNIPFKERLSSYIDLIYYHTNHNVLKSPASWKMKSNRYKSALVSNEYKGFYADKEETSQITDFRGYIPLETNEKIEINKDSEKCFRELLEYCSSHDIPLLVTVSPYVLREGEEFAKEINTFSGIAKEYGVPLLNTNTADVWEKMGLDPSTDFYNGNHMNVLGAEKYTSFLGGYLLENYSLKNHKGEQRFISWQKLYEENYLPYIRPLKEYVMETALDNKQTEKKEKRMRSSINPMEWLSLADDKNITLLFYANGHLDWKPPAEAVIALKHFGLLPYFENSTGTFINIYSGRVLYNDTSGQLYDGKTEMKNKHTSLCVSYEVSTKDYPTAMISIENSPYELGHNAYCLVGEKEVINAVAINNNRAEVFDFVAIGIDKNENLIISHNSMYGER